MKTIASYWDEACDHGAGVLGALPPKTQALAHMTFLAGFAACLDVLASLAPLGEDEAGQKMHALSSEAKRTRERLLSELHGSGGPVQ